MNTKVNPVISIVMVCLNAEKTIEQTILSVLNQKYTHIEFIIKDGGSKDRTLGIIRKYQDKILLIEGRDTGIYNAMNQGKEVASGDYLLFLGADDLLYDENSLERAATHLIDNNTVYYGNVSITSNNRLYDGEFDKLKWGYKNICHQSIFYPRSVYKRFNYCEKYRLVADWVYNLTLLGYKIPFEYINETIARYNDVSGISSVNNDKLFLQERNRLIIKNVGLMPYLYGLIMKAIRQIKRSI